MPDSASGPTAPTPGPSSASVQPASPRSEERAAASGRPAAPNAVEPARCARPTTPLPPAAAVAVGDRVHPAHEAVRALCPRPGVLGAACLAQLGLACSMLLGGWSVFMPQNLFFHFGLAWLIAAFVRSSLLVRRPWKPGDRARGAVGSGGGSTNRGGSPNAAVGAAAARESGASHADRDGAGRHAREASALACEAYPLLPVEEPRVVLFSVAVVVALYAKNLVMDTALTERDLQYEDIALADVDAHSRALFVWAKAQHLCVLIAGLPVWTMHVSILILRLGTRLSPAAARAIAGAPLAFSAAAGALYAPSALDAVLECCRALSSGAMAFIAFCYGVELWRAILFNIEQNSRMSLLARSRIHDLELDAVRRMLQARDRMVLHRARLARQAGGFRGGTLATVEEDDGEEDEEQQQQQQQQQQRAASAQAGSAAAAVGDGAASPGAATDSQGVKATARDIDRSCWRCVSVVTRVALPPPALCAALPAAAFTYAYAPFAEAWLRGGPGSASAVFCGLSSVVCAAGSISCMLPARGRRHRLEVRVVGFPAMLALGSYLLGIALLASLDRSDVELRSLRCAAEHARWGGHVSFAVTLALLYFGRVLLSFACSFRGAFTSAYVLQCYAAVAGALSLLLELLRFDIVPSCAGNPLRLFDDTAHWMVAALLFFGSVFMLATLRERGIRAGAHEAALRRLLERRLGRLQAARGRAPPGI